MWLLMLMPFLAVEAVFTSSGLGKRQTPDISCSSSGSAQCFVPGGSAPTGDVSDFDFIGQNFLHSSTMSGMGGAVARKRSTTGVLGLGIRQSSGGFCCPTDGSWSCNILQAYSIPLCYNYDTTQFAFSDGSYGYDNTGEYYLSNGNRINLLTGDYELTNGTQGNLLVDNGQPAPDTSTVSATGGQGSGSATASATAATLTSSGGAASGSSTENAGAKSATGGPQDAAFLFSVGFLITGFLA